MYGLELLIVISATIGVSMSATGAKGSMSIMGWLIFWRITSGIGGLSFPLAYDNLCLPFYEALEPIIL